MNKTMNKKISPFEMKNIPFILDVVVPLWSPPTGDEAFKRFNVEYIVRNNIFENDFRYELLESQSDEESKEAFCAAAFFARKGDVCKVHEWYEKESKNFPPELKRASEMSRTYLELMDRKTFNMMKDDDIKLSLYVSRKTGCGSILLNEICRQMKEKGFKNLYLWTDVECNWEWYVKHGYELVEKEIYQPFSSEDEDYWTYIFRKTL